MHRCRSSNKGGAPPVIVFKLSSGHSALVDLEKILCVSGATSGMYTFSNPIQIQKHVDTEGKAEMALQDTPDHI